MSPGVTSPVPGPGGHVPTYGGDTILHIPKAAGADAAADNAFVLEVSRKVFAAYVEFQDLPDEAQLRCPHPASTLVRTRILDGISANVGTDLRSIEG